MDTRCMKGLPIKLIIWKNLEKLEGESRNLESLEIKLKNWTDATVMKNSKGYLENMDTSRVIGIPIKLTRWIYLETLEGLSGNIRNQI